MKRKLIAFGILIISIFLISRVQAAKLKEPVVSLTQNGFSPAGLKIKIGTTVRFVNKTGLSFWPASDLHPNHTIYPEFDPKRALSANESWEFTFDKAGTWRFHDHITPINRGTIVVVENIVKSSRRLKTAQNLLSVCEGNEESEGKVDCLIDLLEEVQEKTNSDTAFKLLNDLRNQDAELASFCHTAAHDLGEQAYWKYAKDQKLPKTGSISYCGFGFIHGFMSEFGHHARDFLSSSKKVCGHFSENINYEGFEQMLSPYEMCYHGIGHGVAYYYVPDFGEDVLKIVEMGAKDCGEFGDPLAIDNCQAGLFGGLASAFVGGHGFKIKINEADPLSLCRAQPKELKRGCYDNMIPVIGVIWPDLSKISSFFEDLESDFLRQAFDSVGDFASHLVAEKKLTSQEVASQCGRFLGERKLGCFYGFSQGLVRNYFPSEAPDMALMVCRVESLNQIEKEGCIKGLMVEIKNVLPELYDQNVVKLTEKERKYLD